MEKSNFNNVFEKAFYAYNQTIDFLEFVFKEREEYEHARGNMNFTVRGCFNEFDILLQFSMLEIAYADRCLEKPEIAFMRDLTKYVDIVEFYKQIPGLEKLSWDALSDFDGLLAKILKDTTELVASCAVDFIESIKIYQAKHHNHNFVKVFKNCIGAIMTALACSDGNIEDEECKKGTMMYAVVNDLSQGELDKAEEEVRKQVPTLEKEVNVSSLKSFYKKSNEIHDIGGRKISYQDKELATVYVETDTGSGSGFIISPDGICFTCAHVVDGAKEVYVRLDDEDEDRQVYKVEIKYFDKENDFALLQIIGIKNAYYFDLEENMNTVKTGDDIAVFGFPFGIGLNRNVMELEPSLTKGYISSKNRLNDKKVYYMDAKSCPGNSGGPIFKVSTGKVIGYLCGAYGRDSTLLCYFRGLEEYIELITKNK